MHGHIREREEIPNYVKLKRHNFTTRKQQMLFMIGGL